MTGDQTARLREHLLYLLKGDGAYLNFDKAIAGHGKQFWNERSFNAAYWGPLLRHP